jgi:hypothetical protein
MEERMNRMIRLAILQEVRGLIECGEERLLCFALNRVLCRLRYHDRYGEATNLVRAEVGRLQAEITKDIEDHATLVSWMLADMGYLDMFSSDLPEPYRALCRPSNASHLRLAWIDRMIEDLK